jgi:hypothetical protein
MKVISCGKNLTLLQHGSQAVPGQEIVLPVATRGNKLFGEIHWASMGAPLGKTAGQARKVGVFFIMDDVFLGQLSPVAAVILLLSAATMAKIWALFPISTFFVKNE